MDKVRELKNNFAVYDIVSKHFSLDKKSLKLFKYRLFQERIIPKEYRDIIGDNKDLRRRISINEDCLLAELDEGWKSFKDWYSGYVDYRNITYNDFRKNKVRIGNGQEIKIKKDMENFFLDKKNVEYLLQFIQCDKLRFFAAEGQFIAVSYGSAEYKKHCYDMNLTYANCSTGLKVADYSDSVKDLIKDSILRDLEKIGTQKLPNKEIQVVLSLNFADWFLCSTGESWTSCLNLDSDYHGSYWVGLPELIGDPNRAMIYITSGNKKNYQGIQVDKIMGRAWISIAREENVKSNGFIMFPEYPSNFGIGMIAKKLFGMNILEDDCVYKTKYAIELITKECFPDQDIKLISPIYSDNGKFYTVVVKHKRIGRIIYDGWHGKIDYVIDGEKVNDIDHDVYNVRGLNELIIHKKEIKNSFTGEFIKAWKKKPIVKKVVPAQIIHNSFSLLNKKVIARFINDFYNNLNLNRTI